VQASEVARAVGATASAAVRLGLSVDDAVVLHDSNKLTLRLLPCDVVARVAHAGYEGLQFEVDVARRLAALGCPVAELEPRVAPRVYERDGFVFTLWEHYEAETPRDGVSPVDYATALARLHTGMRTLDVATPHFTDRVAEAHELVASRDRTPELTAADRALLGDILRSARRTIGVRGGAEQVLHGEPHPGNVLSATSGLLFVDFETCCRGPVEFDLAHVPDAVGACYPGADQRLLRECRLVVLAMVAAWRWDAGDQLPNGKEAGDRLLRALRDGPPWPALDAVMPAGR
jgi:Phosphotransferase enzyme family